MESQVVCKCKVDSIFKDSWSRRITSLFKTHKRFKQAEIDLKYHSLSFLINAVKTGDFVALDDLNHVDMRMTVSLIIAAIDRGHFHLLRCFLNKIKQPTMGDVIRPLNYHKSPSLFDLKNVSYIETPLYIGLDPTPYSLLLSWYSEPRDIDMAIVNRSRVLCLFKILYHKFIFLNIDSIFVLVQTLLFETLYH